MLLHLLNESNRLYGGKKVYKLIFALGVLLSVLFGLETNSYASNYLNVKVDSTTNSINLSWDYTPNLSYEIYFEGSKVYSGSQTTYSQTNLSSNYQTQFAVVALNSDRTIVEEVTIDASTLDTGTYAPTKTIMDYQYLESESNKYTKELAISNINVVSSRSEIKLDWDEIPGVTNYEVYRDDVLIGNTQTSQFVDTTTLPGVNYKYEVISKKRFSDEAIDEINQSILELEQSEGEQLSPEDKEQLYYFTFYFIKDVTTPNGNRILFSANSSSVDYKMRYTTFIPDAAAPNPFVIGTYIRGDDRGYSYNASTYRTRADINVHFGKSSSSLSLKKYLHNTELRSKLGGMLIKSYKPQDSGIKLSNKVTKSSYTSFKLSHEVGTGYHPSLTPDINYTMNVTLYKNGKYSFKGTRDQAPSHELYIKKGAAKENKIFAKPNKGFRYLMPGFPVAAISYSN